MSDKKEVKSTLPNQGKPADWTERKDDGKHLIPVRVKTIRGRSID